MMFNNSEVKLQNDFEGKHILTKRKRIKDNQKEEIRVVTAAYISGLPPDITVEELKEIFGKYGVISENPTTKQPRIKIYTDDAGIPKGDALVTYLKAESVDLAVLMLDGGPPIIRNSNGASLSLSISRATFTPKQPTETTPNNLPSSLDENYSKLVQTDDCDGLGLLAKKQRTNNKKKNKKTPDTRLAWSIEDEERSIISENRIQRIPEKFLKIVILKKMFTEEEINRDPSLLLEIKQEIRDECSKIGEVTNVVLYDKEPSGVVAVRFKDELGALACIKLMNGRFYAGSQVEAAHFDGKKYQKSRSGNHAGAEEEEEVRLKAYEDWLNEGETTDT